MKKSLLLLGTLMLTSLTGMAQSFTAEWTKPEAPASFETWELEKSYYLWNVGAQGFYINHQGSGEPYWGTHAMVYSNLPTLVTITRTNPGGNTEDWTKTGVTDNTGLLVSVVTAKSNNKMCSFYTDDYAHVWTDNNGEANRYYQVISLGDKLYHITGSPLSKMYDPTLLLVAVEEGEYKIVRLESEGVNDNDKWAFVNPEPWQKVDAAEALRAAIEEAEGEGVPSSALVNDYAVYNNTSSTLQELQDAAARVQAVNALVMAVGEAKNNGVNPSALVTEDALCDNPAATVAQLENAQARVQALVDLQIAYDEAIAAGVDENIVANEYSELNKSNNTVAEVEKATARVKAVTALKEGIDYASEKGATGLDKYIGIYQNPGSTVEELQAAAVQVKDMARWEEIAPIFENIKQGEKNDVSGVFENNDFSAGGTNGEIPAGWDVTWTRDSEGASNIGYQSASYTNDKVTVSQFIEAWKNANSPNYLSDGSITQTIPSLPSGTYLLAVDCIANNQGRITDPENPNGLPDDVQLFAKASLTGEEHTQALATLDGKPEHFEFAFFHEGGSMTLGLRVVGSAEAKMPANWICMDNLELFYFGEGEVDPAKAMLMGDIADALEKYPILDDDPEEGAIQLDDDKYTSQSYINNYVKVIADAQASTGDYEDYRNRLKAAVENIEKGIAAYDRFLKKWDTSGTGEWQMNFLDFEFDTDEWGNFGDFLQGTTSEGYPEKTPEETLEDHLLTSEEIDAYIEQVDALYRKAFALSLSPGTDCTALLVNASFAAPTETKDFPGWTNNSSGADNVGVWGGLYEYPCVETYGAIVDVYQEIEDLPTGVYELRGQAFQRNQQVVYIYMNEFETLVQEQKADALPKSEAVNKENCWIEGAFDASEYRSTGGTTNLDASVTIQDASTGEDIEAWVPNGMTGSSVAFKAGRYWQSAKGLVKDGKLKVGLTSKGKNAEWMLWSSFQLIYLGEDPDVYGEMLDNSIEAEEKFLKENYNAEDGVQNMTNPALRDYQAAIEQAKIDQQSNNADVLKKALEDLTEASNAVKENILTWGDTKEKRALLDAALNDYYATQEGLDAYEAVATDLAEASLFNKTTAELKVANEKMDELIDLLALANYEGSCSMTAKIVNPGFENETSVTTTIKGWTNSGSIGAQTQSNSSFDKKQGNMYCERWHVNGTIDINQTIANLPAGRYEISAYIYSDAADCVLYGTNFKQVPDGQSGTVEYQVSTPIGVSQRYRVIVALPEDGDLKFGVKWSDTGDRWTCIDDFTLTYYGSSDVVGIDGVESAQSANLKNRKVFENGRIVIYKNGQKFNVAGQAIK